MLLAKACVTLAMSHAPACVNVLIIPTGLQSHQDRHLDEFALLTLLIEDMFTHHLPHRPRALAYETRGRQTQTQRPKIFGDSWSSTRGSSYRFFSHSAS